MSEEPDNPAWFNPEKHALGPGGAFERDTGLTLAPDGVPMAGAIRARRLALAGATTDKLALIPDTLIASAKAAMEREAEALTAEERPAAEATAAEGRPAAEATAAEGRPARPAARTERGTTQDTADAQ